MENKQLFNSRALVLGLPEFECQRCGHKWIPRKNEIPRVCAKCKNAGWDRPRVRAPKKNKTNFTYHLDSANNFLRSPLYLTKHVDILRPLSTSLKLLYLTCYLPIVTNLASVARYFSHIRISAKQFSLPITYSQLSNCAPIIP
jgi:hypothetical protein